ncbi:MAG: Uma2 family endonuclease [Bacteroidetes bacterium]|nr:Uma2 family endonuclease [Bacteroidota bacterium]
MTATVEESTIHQIVKNEQLVFKSRMSREQFHRFVLKNTDLRIERDKYGSIIIYPLMTFDSGYNEGEVFFHLKFWSKSNQLGRAFSPSTSFDLPDGSQRKADGAWISMEKIDALSEEERKSIALIVPDFVMEVRSETDRMSQVKKKMSEAWIANGVKLAWLIDPIKEKAWIYRENGTVEEVDGFDKKLSGEGILPGFELNLSDLKA